jgi:outer membrane protein
MKTLLLLLFVVTACQCKAQSAPSVQKIGHADWDYIFSRMPEYKQIEKDIKSFEAQLQNQLKVRASELESKYKAYQTMPSDAPDAIRKDKESELAYLQENIEKFRQEAQTSMQKKQTNLITPVINKVGRAIEQVAVENGFSYIINPQMIGGGDVLLFTDESYNISNLVLNKLGVEAAND